MTDDTIDHNESWIMSLKLLSEKLQENMPLNPLKTMPMLASTQ